MKSREKRGNCSGSRAGRLCSKGPGANDVEDDRFWQERPEAHAVFHGGLLVRFQHNKQGSCDQRQIL